MSAEQNWKVPTNAEDFFSQQTRRLGQEERRPSVRKASDLLGPGIAPYAVEVDDFNGDIAAFNGFYVAAPAADNSPNATKWWIGQTVADRFNGGWQMFATFRAEDLIGGQHTLVMRSFTVAPDSPSRFYSAWQQVAPVTVPDGWSDRVSLSSYLLSGITASVIDIRRNGKDREIRGNPTFSLTTGSSDVTTALPVGDRPSANIFANCYLAGGNVGVAFIRPAGTIAINNMSGATRSGAHQFTISYTVD